MLKLQKLIMDENVNIKTGRDPQTKLIILLAAP
jgi:hypothetical protein